MSDNYDAVYNAIRSKFHMPDIDDIIRRSFDISWQLDAVKAEFINAAQWAEDLGIERESLEHRLRNQAIEKALTTPYIKRKAYNYGS